MDEVVNLHDNNKDFKDKSLLLLLMMDFIIIIQLLFQF